MELKHGGDILQIDQLAQHRST